MAAAKSMRLGICLYGVASAAAGIMDLIWANFEAAINPSRHSAITFLGKKFSPISSPSG